MKATGYQFLIEKYALDVLSPYKKCFLTTHAIRHKEIMIGGEEEFFPVKYKVGDSWHDHLIFALKYEGVNLAVMKALFPKIKQDELVELIQSKRTSVYLRKIWFFYEFLMRRELQIPAVKTGNYALVLEPEDYFALDNAHSIKARRQRLICNLPGTADFCPMVRMTSRIKTAQQTDYHAKFAAMIAQYPSELIYRASQFLYLKETKSSYAIEQITPDRKRTGNFMAMLQQAGRNDLTKELLIQLQNCIVDERYADSDYRGYQVYVGQSITPGYELVHYIAPKPEDVTPFMEAFLSVAYALIHSETNPVITAAALSFFFVFLHPFGDGNGRLHRYLLHHILTQRRFGPEGVIFPVSAVMYKNAKQYDEMLESFSAKLIPKIQYKLNDIGEMTVINSTADYYRYIDFTRIVEEFYQIVETTLQTELIPELDYLLAWDRAREKMRNVVDMPEQKALQFITFVQQNNGTFPKRRRELFVELSDDEVAKLADIVNNEIFKNRDIL
jgi:hypothetical protein